MGPHSNCYDFVEIYLYFVKTITEAQQKGEKIEKNPILLEMLL